MKDEKVGLPSVGYEDQQISQRPAWVLRQSTWVVDTHSNLDKPSMVCLH